MESECGGECQRGEGSEGRKERILKGGGRGGQWRWELRRGY